MDFILFLRKREREKKKAEPHKIRQQRMRWHSQRRWNSINARTLLPSAARGRPRTERHFCFLFSTTRQALRTRCCFHSFRIYFMANSSVKNRHFFLCCWPDYFAELEEKKHNTTHKNRDGGWGLGDEYLFDLGYFVFLNNWQLGRLCPPHCSG